MNVSIGGKFPNLELTDHEGNKVRLTEVAGKFPLIVIFYRGYW